MSFGGEYLKPVIKEIVGIGHFNKWQPIEAGKGDIINARLGDELMNGHEANYNGYLVCQ